MVAALGDHCFDLSAVEIQVCERDAPVIVSWAEIEDAQVDRHLTFDLSHRSFPEDWLIRSGPTGPASPSLAGAERMADAHNGVIWHEDVQ